MKISERLFGTLSDGTEVSLFTVRGTRLSFSATSYGCRITSIKSYDVSDEGTELTHGYSTLDGYVFDTCHFGSFIGRFANRIGGASFSLDGKKYALDKNKGPNTLHGGFDAWDKKVWAASVVKGKDYAGMKFSRVSPDMEQGFPGTMKVTVEYLLGSDDTLTCRYTATTDKPTPVNFTNHAYFNLAGKGDVKNHLLKLDCPSYLEISPALIPTGKILSVKGTPLDFTKEKKIGRDIAKTDVGYDHSFVTKAYNAERGIPLAGAKLVRVAEVSDPASGRRMTVDTNLEGIQFYTGNGLRDVRGRDGTVYKKWSALCLETGLFPNSPNRKTFPSCILLPGEKLCAVTVFGFSF